MPRPSRRTLLLPAVTALAAAAGLVVNATGALSQLERQTVDARFSIRGRQAPDPRMLVVAIDDRTFDPPPTGLGLRWPFPRRYHARLIDRLRAAGARVIVFDVEFTAATDERDDNALVQAITSAGNVVLAADAVGPNGQTGVLGGEKTLRQAHARAGYAVYRPDRGGVVRRMQTGLSGLATLPIAAASLYLARQPSLRHLRSDRTAWIDYPGPAGTVPALSYADVLHGRFAAREVRGRIVVIGASYPPLQDLHATSTTDSAHLMAGAELNADAIATVLQGFPIREAPGPVAVLLVLLLAAIPALANARLPAVLALGAAVATTAVFLTAAQLAFDRGVIVATVAPLCAAAVAAVGGLAVNYLDEAFRRQATRLAFARFVPSTVVDEVLAASGPGVRLGGVRRVATVMFSDLRGFTSFSEALEPERVIEILNRYLTAMSDAILDHGGTLVAYMGDGIMAVFGAPLVYEDHADRALGAARDMLAALDRFNEWLSAEHGFPPLRMGIGLNSGPVMSGNVGSEQRLEYTALGDTTNTAARLEGMTKGTPHQLFIAESTKEMLTCPAGDLVPVGELAVRGRQAAVVVWSIGASAVEPGAGGTSEPATPFSQTSGEGALEADDVGRP